MGTSFDNELEPPVGGCARLIAIVSDTAIAKHYETGTIVLKVGGEEWLDLRASSPTTFYLEGNNNNQIRSTTCLG